MDEITAIRDLLADPPPPSPEGYGQGATSARQPDRRRAMLPHGGRLTRPAILSAAAVGAAAALVAVALIPVARELRAPPDSRDWPQSWRGSLHGLSCSPQPSGPRSRVLAGSSAPICQ